MKLLLSGLDTVECAYYLRPGSACKLDFASPREKREMQREAKNRDGMVIELGGKEFLLSPNGTRSGYPFLISNQHLSIQFGEFNEPNQACPGRSGTSPSRLKPTRHHTHRLRAANARRAGQGR